MCSLSDSTSFAKSEVIGDLRPGPQLLIPSSQSEVSTKPRIIFIQLRFNLASWRTRYLSLGVLKRICSKNSLGQSWLLRMSKYSSEVITSRQAKNLRCPSLPNDEYGNQNPPYLKWDREPAMPASPIIRNIAPSWSQTMAKPVNDANGEVVVRWLRTFKMWYRSTVLGVAIELVMAARRKDVTRGLMIQYFHWTRMFLYARLSDTKCDPVDGWYHLHASPREVT